jgi:hypothetical protein
MNTDKYACDQQQTTKVLLVRLAAVTSGHQAQTAWLCNSHWHRPHPSAPAQSPHYALSSRYAFNCDQAQLWQPLVFPMLCLLPNTLEI